MPGAVAFDRLKANSPSISAGIISAVLLSLGREVSILEEAGAGPVHFDVMDGCFTPMLTVGPPFIKSIKTSLLKDVHLMVTNPERKVKDFVEAGADIVSFHVEACSEPLALLREMGKMENANDPERGIVRGVALMPGTSVDTLKPLMEEVELVVLLAVDPVAGKHPAMEVTRERAETVKGMMGDNALLCVDGGVKKNNIAGYAGMGADMYVSGSAVFENGATVENLRFMTTAIRN